MEGAGRETRGHGGGLGGVGGIGAAGAAVRPAAPGTALAAPVLVSTLGHFLGDFIPHVRGDLLDIGRRPAEPLMLGTIAASSFFATWNETLAVM